MSEVGSGGRRSARGRRSSICFLRGGALAEDAAQRGEAVAGLAFDGAVGAAEYPGDVGDGLVTEEAQDEDGLLAGREPGECGLNDGAVLGVAGGGLLVSCTRSSAWCSSPLNR
jgi:hypothetical protein